MSATFKFMIDFPFVMVDFATLLVVELTCFQFTTPVKTSP
jgi:hypothetical protein